MENQLPWADLKIFKTFPEDIQNQFIDLQRKLLSGHRDEAKSEWDILEIKIGYRVSTSTAWKVGTERDKKNLGEGEDA